MKTTKMMMTTTETEDAIAQFMLTDEGRTKLAQCMVSPLQEGLTREAFERLAGPMKPLGTADWDRLEKYLEKDAGTNPAAARGLANLRARRRLGLLSS